MNQIDNKDIAEIVAILKRFREDHCMTTDLESIDCRNRCGELIEKVRAIATLDDQTAARLLQSLSRWKVGTKIRNKRHGLGGIIVAPLSRNGLINVDVGIGIKVGEHVSDWDYVCGPEGEDA